MLLIHPKSPPPPPLITSWFQISAEPFSISHFLCARCCFCLPLPPPSPLPPHVIKMFTFFIKSQNFQLLTWQCICVFICICVLHFPHLRCSHSHVKIFFTSQELDFFQSLENWKGKKILKIPENSGSWTGTQASSSFHL